MEKKNFSIGLSTTLNRLTNPKTKLFVINHNLSLPRRPKAGEGACLPPKEPKEKGWMEKINSDKAIFKLWNEYFKYYYEEL